MITQAEARTIADIGKENRDAERREKFAPNVARNLAKIEEQIKFMATLGGDACTVEIEDFVYEKFYYATKKDQYEAIAEELVNLGYECKPVSQYKKIKVFW